MEKKVFEAANREYSEAAKLAPQIVEIRFWQAATLAKNGRVDEALPVFREVFAKERRWVEVVPRLVPAGLLPDDKELLGKIAAQAGK
jgi:tetratricopeptide (TPR) repeat protein